MKPIIDVSAFQGTIDWKAVSGNIEAAIIRLGYRGYGNGRIVYDTKYKENRAACEALGIPFSLYFFPTSITDAEAVEEADFIIQEAKGMKFVLPIFLDSEYAEGSGKGRSDQLSRADRTRFLRIICERLQANGIPAGVYASTSWIKSRLDASQLPFSWWVAQWASKLNYSSDWLIWQYTSKGSVPGISGNVDCSQRNTSKPVTVPETAVKGVTAEDVLAVMRSWIGLSRSAGTHHVIIDTYNSYTPRARGYKVSYTDAFCDTTVSAAFIKLGAVDLIGGPECGVEEHVKLFKKAGIWEEDGTVTPEPGWLIVYNWDDNTQPNDGFSDHIGIVEKVSGGMITAIEGNISGGVVGRTTRKIGHGNIRGYAKPKYGTSSGSARKSVEELAREVLAGVWGNGDDRKARLTAAGYDYSAVQTRVNQLVAAPEPAKKTVDELAKEVLAGSWGNGQERKDRLTAAGYDYNAVQSKVNALVSGSSKSIDELAQEVIAGKWGNGSDRKARLTAAGYDYARVQAKVNKLLS